MKFDMLANKPRVRGDCVDGPRPCGWCSCKFNLLIDVLDEGAIVLNADIKRPEARGRAIVPKAWADDLFADQLEDFVEYFFDEPDPPRPSCALDEADRVGAEGMQLDEISDMMFVTRERVRQIEAEGLQMLRQVQDFAHLNPNDPDESHDHVAYVCRTCKTAIVQCPCTDVEKRIEISHRSCTTCRTEQQLAATRTRFVNAIRDRAESVAAENDYADEVRG